MDVLVAGATGFFGRRVVDALLECGHTVRALVRSEPEPPLPAGVRLFRGDLEAADVVREACAGAEAVISAVSPEAVPHQHLLEEAARDAGTVRRFVPSEYGIDPLLAARGECVVFDLKLAGQERLSGVPCTFVYANCFATHWATGLGQVLAEKPGEEVEIYAGGTTKAAVLSPDDVARVVARTIEDPRTANAHLTLLPPGNLVSQRELVDLWTTLTGNAPRERPVTAEELDRRVEGQVGPMGGVLSQFHRTVWVHGHGARRRDDVLDAGELYPDIEFTPVEAMMTSFLGR